MSTSTIKISELTQLTDLDSNTSNTLFVVEALTSNITATVSATTLSQHLFANNVLVVGQNPVIFDNTIAQLSNTDSGFIQVNIQNYSPNGSADLVLTTDDGTNTSAFVDLGINNSQWDSSVLGQTAQYPYDGFLIVDGPLDDPRGNLVIGTANPSTNLVFSIGGLTTTDVPAVMTDNGLVFKNGAYVTFADNTQQTTAAATLEYSESAFAVANAATDSITYLSGVNLGQNTFSQGAYNKANNALANTTGTFDGDLTVTGNTSISYQLRVQKSDMPGNNQYVIVTGTSGGAIGVPSNDGYTFHSATDGGNRIVGEAYSNTATQYASFIARRARGTAENPLPTQAGDIIARFGGNGYGTTKFSQFSDGRMEVVATENHTDTAKGTRIRFVNTANGTNSSTEIASFEGDTVMFTGVVNPQKGFVFTPNVISGITATTLNVDFSKDSLKKLEIDNNLNITLSNYTTGKIVELWIVNSSGSNRTVTHGCLALNSTVNSTTVTIPATSCAYFKYFSIDGDNANTFVQINAA